MHGDELRLVGPTPASGGDENRWSCDGTVIKVADSMLYLVYYVYCR